MAKSKGKITLRITEIIMAILIGVSGIASLLAWGTNGFVDWRFSNWTVTVPADPPHEDNATAQSFALAASPRSAAFGSRAMTSEAAAELETYINSNSGTKDVTTDSDLAKIIVKNNLNNKTVSAKEAGIRLLTDKATGFTSSAVLVPRVNPFGDGYIYKETTCIYNGADKPNMYKSRFDHWDYYMDMSFNYSLLVITYELEPDPNAVQPLPPAPTKEGYTFAGWFYGTEAEHGENCVEYLGETVTANTNLHAHFDINKFTVKYDTAGGTAIADQIVDWNTELTAPTPERRGYEFKGWYLSDGTKYTGQAIKEDTTLTAQWEIKTFTVTFYVEGEVYTTKEVKYGTTFAELAEEAKGLNLRVTSVMTEYGDQPIEYFSYTPITDNYSVVSDKMNLREIIINVLQKYPWIIFACGGVLAVIVGIVGGALYLSQNKKQAKRRKKR